MPTTGITRLRPTRTVRVVAAATGALVAQRTFQGGEPVACLPSEPASKTEIRGSAVRLDDIKPWLAELVQA